MEPVLIFFIVLTSMVIIASAIYLIATRFSKDDEYVSRDNFVFNFSSRYSKGYAFGIEQKADPGKHGRTICEFMPLDVMPEELSSVKPQQIVVGRNKRITLSKGDLSGNRSIVLYLPENAEDISEKIKQTPLGKSFAHYIETKGAEETELNYLREGSKMKDKLANELNGGELSVEMLAQVKKFISDSKELVSDSKSHSEKKGFTAPVPPSRPINP